MTYKIFKIIFLIKIAAATALKITGFRDYISFLKY